MAKLAILEYPNQRLRLEAKAIDKFDVALQRQIDDMFETMYAAPGIGLAATQVDIQKRLFVLDISERKDQPMVFINPEIVEASGHEEMEEGCLSFPGVYAKVQRAEKVTVSALDRDGKPFTLEADELLAVCIQHELDHLDGKLFVDLLSPLKRKMLDKKLKKLQRSRPS
jgi:peptide deformylase|tara:strand:+ start:6687 stop:7193 length:507 start_codon:yes stop_codon:yes gene_type:complete